VTLSATFARRSDNGAVRLVALHGLLLVERHERYASVGDALESPSRADYWALTFAPDKGPADVVAPLIWPVEIPVTVQPDLPSMYLPVESWDLTRVEAS